MLSNVDLQQLARHYQIPLLDTPLRDTLAKGGPRPGVYICNLDSASSGAVGTHWTCLVCTQMEAIYVDSFGAPAPPEIANWIKSKYPRGFGWNNWVLQDVKSSTCGFWCLCIAIQAFHHHLPGETVSDCVNRWISGFDEKGNEAKMREWLRSQPPKIHPLVKSKLK